ncbi:uncharacterized protein (TIGR02145 family) [Parabacteroides sp. PH5-13]|uniref:hypothetical protein n=1 Tax=unclassified Parabacteroides TaxID=2649774 RepID=UPI002473EE58|nr:MULTISPECIES: hypothetical protein [unclassified Parabacteroides]MDH6306317.1 uncharacterized protein (TIGR02145 family) [Parabacteroides sp. PH5-39]MDH6320961.1 uncharacterized protein (TIGR02145 family) [Parabacteroides sp. PH5-13]MDH6324693.1 uncharacterized protein (TIGR02145 family) [Parabacteroides sp. PH5-8]MDH6385872.1 uncharacterized protein (TIGR02145 family) [Parabacteroides sp. PH5-17]MDH6395161.1 uncharacterized protein (TIGR02145 family) [Parabacteroides sp. PFB2-22]
MKRIRLKLTVWLAVIAGTIPAYSQVTVGSDITPTRAALLEIKTQQTSGKVASVTDDKNITSGKDGGGFLLPRVKLVNTGTLEPFIEADDDEFVNNVGSLKEKLAGLMVYNITNNGGALYPAVYTWNGAYWVTSQANEAVSSITKQPKKFTFYELGTETPAALEFKVDGQGDWSYQWYQVTGNNVHVRIGTAIGGSGTVTGTGATTSKFMPTGVIKGTTRNAKNAGFYKFYCIANSSLGAELTSDIAEVAVGCGAKNNAGEWLSFMCFNLGATTLTIEAQKNYAMTFNPANDSDGRHYYIAGEENLYGDLYQWGRIGDGHEKRGASAGFVAGQKTAGTNQVAYNTTTPPSYEDGNKINIQTYPWRQVKRDTDYYGKFITVTSAQNLNWAHNLIATQIDILWRTGRYTSNDPCAKIKEDGINYETYYPATNGTTAANTYWRTPSQDEWRSLYKGGAISGASATATANTWVWNSTNGRGFEIKPDGETTTLFLPVNGYRAGSNGMLFHQGSGGYYWTIGTIGTSAYNLSFSTSNVNPAKSSSRGSGYALRCIKSN